MRSVLQAAHEADPRVPKHTPSCKHALLVAGLPPLLQPILCLRRPSPAQDVNYTDAIVAALCLSHSAVARLLGVEAEPEANSDGRDGKPAVVGYVSPRDYIDFISQYVTLYSQRRAAIEARQLHLNVGLDRIKETEAQVGASCVFHLMVNVSSCDCLWSDVVAGRQAEGKPYHLQARSDSQDGGCQRQAGGHGGGSGEAERRKAASLSMREELARQNKEIETRDASAQASSIR